LRDRKQKERRKKRETACEDGRRGKKVGSITRLLAGLNRPKGDHGEGFKQTLQKANIPRRG